MRFDGHFVMFYGTAHALLVEYKSLLGRDRLMQFIAPVMKAQVS